MLKEALEYTHVDVSGIRVEGNILPARDKRGNGAWRALKAEDAAYLVEMVCERDDDYLTFFGNSGYGPASNILRWSIWLRLVSRYLNEAFGIKYRPGGSNVPIGGVVEAEYNFSQVNNVSSTYLCDVYPDAFILAPSTSYSQTNPRVLNADVVRKMFYDLSRIVRFWSKNGGTESGSEHWTYDFLDYDQSGDSHTSGDYQDVRPTWILEAWGYEGRWCSIHKKTVTSASCTGLFGTNPPHYAEYVSDIVAFMRLTTWISNTNSYLDGTVYEDFVPVACVKSGNAWNLPSGFFTDGIAEEAVRRHGGDPTATLTRMPEDTTGMTKTFKSIAVFWDVYDVVCLCKFPSDFFELGWGREP